ncbi:MULTISPECIES: hypothetical protein [unclassified Pseudoalteromonas]|uniref:hypothetical protein n=1 Tax=unclassified Pseudoalteromonas TaxID=194690 RepID=UPI0016025B33|nr:MULTISPECIES: hypothetical protein [unclassified Pseudoalteromonas]MBB1295688.1 hypothetical protein [Pseudoalteromonas sp. SR41-4]MBB1411731.1 hypothetical protein [Pseudoalteromonas sp. SG44-17]
MQLLESSPVKLTQPLTLQATPDQVGLLPEGTTLYSYSSGPSTETYVVFISSQNLMIVEPIKFPNFMTVDPLYGYIDSEK